VDFPLDIAGQRSVATGVFRPWLENILALQILDPSSPDYGSYPLNGDGWQDGRQSAFEFARVASCLCWFGGTDETGGSPALLEACQVSLRAAMQFLVNRQHADGRMDLAGFYSPNEAGFPVAGLALAWENLGKLRGDPLADVRETLRNFLLKSTEAVLQGDAYTANHRWAAACAALASVHRLWPDRRYLDKIESYLEDGIDCDADGCWFEERSPNYNDVANSGMLVLADCLGRPEFLEPVIRSHEFALHTLQPNGEADSSFSHRADRAASGLRATSLGVARRVALITGDGRFTSLTRHVWAQGSDGTNNLIPYLFDLMMHPGDLPQPVPLSSRYKKRFASIPMVRERRGETSLTVTADRGNHYFDTVLDQWGGRKCNDDWLHLHHGYVVLQSLQLAGGGLNAFQPLDVIEDEDGVLILHSTDNGWKHPLHFRPGRPVVDMPRNWTTEAQVTWKDDALEIGMQSETPESIAACLLLWVRPGISLSESGSDPVPLQAKAVHALRGGSDVTLTGTRGAITISGLPASAHRRAILGPQPIPSGMRDTCALLQLGLRFPVNLNLTLHLTRP